MAIFHLAHSFVRRSNGSSSIATAAYNSGEKLDDNKGSIAYSDYTRKGGVLYDDDLPASEFTVNGPTIAASYGGGWNREKINRHGQNKPFWPIISTLRCRMN